MTRLFFLLPLILFIQPAQANEGFRAWLSQAKAEATGKGLSSGAVNNALTQASFIPRVIELDRKQPEGKMTFDEYRARIVSSDRISKGRAMMQKHRTLLNQVSSKYGVPPQYIVALWGIETNYGSNTGGYDVISSLATLAYEGRRAEFFKGELFNALRILHENHISLENMKGSWAGAMGQCQFMPSSFNAYAVDYNGDGRRDIWTTQEDVFASMANYLRQSGWKYDQKWGREVRVPPHQLKHLASRDIKKALPEWQKLGVRLVDGGNLPPAPAGFRASLIIPEGNVRDAFLAYDNYNVIMKWNRSIYFASSVGLLADAIAQ